MASSQTKFRLIRSSSVKKDCLNLLDWDIFTIVNESYSRSLTGNVRGRVYCKARLHTNGNEIVKRTGGHLHDPDILGVKCLELKARVKPLARNTHDGTHQIMGEELEESCEATVAKLPKLESIKRTIRRERDRLLKQLLYNQTAFRIL
eukprot:TRINITY_DN15743_c0_g1_i1.p1 TRINITY_DN15743_c0_g1~~TRINITY_DN15743_c0_g1_i1.p1  ORF type:complete len:148 (-),score=7.23 TRINITY_DN15743_c0_g1_i1:165-608(-)